MNNIFENAYFGKVYKTNKGKLAIYNRTFSKNPPSKWDFLEPNNSDEYREYLKWLDEAPDIEIHSLLVEGYDIVYFYDNGKSERFDLEIISEFNINTDNEEGV